MGSFLVRNHVLIISEYFVAYVLLVHCLGLMSLSLEQLGQCLRVILLSLRDTFVLILHNKSFL